MPDQNSLKEAAAEAAMQFLPSSGVIGLGTGTTASYAIRLIARRVAEGAALVGVATSSASAEAATAAGIPLLAEEGPWEIAVTFDGADEVSPALDLIKGGGGALLREKIVAQASRRVVIVVDESKLSAALATRHALPVEITRFGSDAQERFVRSLGGRPVLRRMDAGEPYETDQGNWILDCAFSPIFEPRPLAERLAERAGIVEHGLFCGLATDVIVASADGVRVLTRGKRE